MGWTRVPGLRDGSGGQLEGGWPFHVNANNVGELLATGPCMLDSVVVGKAGSADWAVTIYDSANAAGATAASEVGVFDFNAGGTYMFDCIFENGVWIVVSGTTAGDLTFIIADPSKI